MKLFTIIFLRGTSIGKRETERRQGGPWKREGEKNAHLNWHRNRDRRARDKNVFSVKFLRKYRDRVGAKYTSRLLSKCDVTLPQVWQNRLSIAAKTAEFR